MKSYDPKQVVCIVGGGQITGFAEGSFLTVERDEDSFALTVGADGEGTRAKSNNKAGKFTFRLAASSDANRFLSNLALSDELNNAGIVPVLIKDMSGASLHGAEQAYIVKPATAEYSKENTEREWVLQTDNLQTFVGGNA